MEYVIITKSESGIDLKQVRVKEPDGFRVYDIKNIEYETTYLCTPNIKTVIVEVTYVADGELRHVPKAHLETISFLSENNAI